MPTLTELEWRIKPTLAEWAEVASFDAPGVGGRPLPATVTPQTMGDNAVYELDRLGWERCVVVGDEFGGHPAVEAALARRDRVVGLAFGHACLSFRRRGERAPLNGEVLEAFFSLVEVDYGTYVRHLTQLTQNAYDDELADSYRERVPQETAVAAAEIPHALQGVEIESDLRALQRPLLFARHDGCLAWTDEGYEDAVAAFPDAKRVSTEVKPSGCPAFAEALRAFCAELDWT